MGQVRSVDVSTRLRDALFMRDLDTVQAITTAQTDWERNVTYTHFCYALNARCDFPLLRRICNVVRTSDLDNCISLAALQNKEEPLRVLLRARSQSNVSTTTTCELSGMLALILSDGSLNVFSALVESGIPLLPNDVGSVTQGFRRAVATKDVRWAECVVQAFPMETLAPTIVERIRMVCSGTSVELKKSLLNILEQSMQPYSGRENACLRPLSCQKRAKAFLVASISNKQAVPLDQSTLMLVCAFGC
eukprot:PhF_6_TR44459/c0_g1_i1/m.68437